MAKHVAIQGLRHGPFVQRIARKPLATLGELYEQFKKYCRADNDNRLRIARDAIQKQQNQPTQKPNNRTPFYAQHPAQYVMQVEVGALNQLKPFSYQPNPSNNSFQEPKNKPSQRGKGRGTAPSSNPTHYCAYHGKNSMHDTEQCRDIKKTVEKMRSEKLEGASKPIGHKNTPPVPTQPYCPIFPALNSNVVQPSTLASSYMQPSVAFQHYFPNSMPNSSQPYHLPQLPANPTTHTQTQPIKVEELPPHSQQTPKQEKAVRALHTLYPALGTSCPSSADPRLTLKRISR